MYYRVIAHKLLSCDLKKPHLRFPSNSKLIPVSLKFFFFFFQIVLYTKFLLIVMDLRQKSQIFLKFLVRGKFLFRKIFHEDYQHIICVALSRHYLPHLFFFSVILFALIYLCSFVGQRLVFFFFLHYYLLYLVRVLTA